MCFYSRTRILERLRSRTRKHDDESSTRDTRTAPVESIMLPTTSVSHRDGDLHSHALEDAKALHELFGTPSSVRGYKTARVVPKRDSSPVHLTSDADVATQTPARSANTKLGALGHAVKQRLSESRLTKESAKTILKRKHSLDSVGACRMLSTSFASTGLTDLLMSRTASEGGYDSDAKDISTLTWRKSIDHDSSKISLEHFSEALRPIFSSSTWKASAALPIEECKPDLAEANTESQDVGVEGLHHRVTLATGHTQNVGAPESNRGDGNGTLQRDEHGETVASASLSLSDEQYIHPGDIRISQRLVTSSVMPISFLSSAEFSSGMGHDDEADLPPEEARRPSVDLQRSSMDNDLPWHLHRQPSTAARYPGFVTQEHNRKPSDPKTRKLFEDVVDAGKPYPKWNTITSSNSVRANVIGCNPTRNNASSYSMPEGEIPESVIESPTGAAHLGIIKNPNSRAVPSRRVSTGLSHRQQSLGHFSSPRKDTWLGEAKDKEQHSLQESDDILGPSEEDKLTIPMSGERRRKSKESRLPQERLHQHPIRSRRSLHSVEADEGMSEITHCTIQERRHERMSQIDPGAQKLEGKFDGGSHNTRSTSEGWLTEGRRFMCEYNFISRTSSRNSSLSQNGYIDKGPTNEATPIIWQPVATAREEVPFQSPSKSTLDVPLWSDLAQRETLISRDNEQEAQGPNQPRSIASERRPAPSQVMAGQRDPLENHQRMLVEAQKSLPGLCTQRNARRWNNETSQATSETKSSEEESSVETRRHAISGVDDRSKTTPATFKDDFISWCKFPSHAREERNGPANEKDNVRVRDFCRTTPCLERSDFPSNLTIQKNRSSSSPGASFRGSWQKRGLGHMERKSKSRTMSWGSGSPKHEAVHRSLFLQLKDFYRSQSSDLRRIHSGHPSSVTLARESEYPVLDIPAGFGSLMLSATSLHPYWSRSLNQVRLRENTDDDSFDLASQSDAKLPCAGTGSSTENQIENSYTTGETRGQLQRQEVRKKSNSKALDGTVCSRVSEECAGGLTGSDRDVRFTQQQCGNSADGSFVSVTASNGFGDETGDFGLQGHEFCLMSTELRNSTTDFRRVLKEREQRSREDLLKLAQRLNGAGGDEGDMEV